MKCSTSFKILPPEDGGLQPDTNFELFIYKIIYRRGQVTELKIILCVCLMFQHLLFIS